ncbi:amidase [Rhodanobacter sp. AS-Z3]|uniref:amidase n=1 Tax=Rhodanobacter sp. AS-Z3 TaxID=3031330 RepID=UPI0024795003|nr:amidase [Rhodanobacter sp. AS-Z3]WEN14140.1 amidase [Rhodanobacter sp. AS-Z3]
MNRVDPLLLGEDLTAQLARLDMGGLGCVELLEQQLAAITASQPILNAYVAIDESAARAAAADSDARRKAGQARALEGVTIAIKDNLDVAGMVSTAGMATRRDAAVAVRDSTAVARLREAGAVIIGKLNMHEAALGADNNNPHFGACHNPHRPGFTPGGSSGGSGAAVAAGLCSAALGTDSMGSVRIPASYCGVVGLKPSWGAISTHGSVALSHRLDHVGPLTRSARDLRRLLPVLAGFDPASAQSRSITMLPTSTGPLRLGIVDFGDAVHCNDDVAAEFVRSLDVLFGLGHRRVDLPAPAFPPGHARRAGLLVCEAELLVEHRHDWQHQRDRFSPMLAKLMSYAEGRSAADLVDASRLLDRAQVQLQQWLAACDVLVTPTTPQRAFAFADAVPANQADLTGYANFSGNPALSVPMAVGEGELPLGLQLVGRVGDELRLIALAEAFQHATRWQPRLPAASHSWGMS